MLPNVFAALLLASPALAAVRTKPVVMPFNTHYGLGSSSSWFSVPLTVGSTDFNLSISTSLQHTWIPGASVCESASNKTSCALPLGGELPGSVSGSTVVFTDEVKGTYDGSASLLPARKEDPQTPLALTGKGVISQQELTVSANTGTFKISGQQSVGVFTTEAPLFNGYLSLPQVASALQVSGITPGNNFHLFLGAAAETNYSTPPSANSYDAKSYTLIFGGYDKSVFDLNQTQQYRIEGSGRRLQASVEDIIYRWTKGGDTDNSLLPASHTVVIDTTTPYLWLPQSAVDILVQVSGAVWNDSMDAYSFTRCFASECTAAEATSYDAVLDFILTTGQKLTLSFDSYFRLKTLWWEDLWTENRPVLPVRPLKNEKDPIILGRAVMAALHLWVDYDGQYFGLKTGNLSDYSAAEVVPWGEGHAPITNKTILAPPSTPSSSSAAAATSSAAAGSGYSSPTSSKKTVIAGIAAAGVALAIAGAVTYCWLRRGRRASTPMTTEQKEPISTVPELPQGEYYKLQEMDTKPAPLRHDMSGYGAPTPLRHEMSGYGAPAPLRHEMSGYGAPAEMAGGPPQPPHAVYEMPAWTGR